ncbi:hypothetical protein BJ508DRAFT_306312 [Ascobolus immersus RN42]|uniref:Uncharacterized protein n=1 Tax=Ascobolus immersus RN42 TaxID=1160509 RepID=A0A3N4IBV8_ASCIM|nr:hypothetical protein BJ508DRAFT_306312 [Ascobolus immersus RN42]
MKSNLLFTMRIFVILPAASLAFPISYLEATETYVKNKDIPAHWTDPAIEQGNYTPAMLGQERQAFTPSLQTDLDRHELDDAPDINDVIVDADSAPHTNDPNNQAGHESQPTAYQTDLHTPTPHPNPLLNPLPWPRFTFIPENWQDAYTDAIDQPPFQQYWHWRLRQLCGLSGNRSTQRYKSKVDPCLNQDRLKSAVYDEYRAIVDTKGRQGLPEMYKLYQNAIRGDGFGWFPMSDFDGPGFESWQAFV